MLVELAIRNRRKKETVRVLEARRHDKDVMEVRFQLAGTGAKFRYVAGQYLFLHCPEVSHGWHPPVIMLQRIFLD